MALNAALLSGLDLDFITFEAQNVHFAPNLRDHQLFGDAQIPQLIRHCAQPQVIQQAAARDTASANRVEAVATDLPVAVATNRLWLQLQVGRAVRRNERQPFVLGTKRDVSVRMRADQQHERRWVELGAHAADHARQGLGRSSFAKRVQRPQTSRIVTAHGPCRVTFGLLRSDLLRGLDATLLRQTARLLLGGLTLLLVRRVPRLLMILFAQP